MNGNEQWRDISGYEGIYQVSDAGRIKSVRTGQLRSLVKDKDGYLQLKLHKNGVQETHKVHRLVARAFIPNLEKLPLINHKNEDKRDNRVDNLEWCTKEYNNFYGVGSDRYVGRRKEVIRMNPHDDSDVATYASICAAAEACGVLACSISQCCSGKLQTAGGYVWKYA